MRTRFRNQTSAKTARIGWQRKASRLMIFTRRCSAVPSGWESCFVDTKPALLSRGLFCHCRWARGSGALSGRCWVQGMLHPRGSFCAGSSSSSSSSSREGGDWEVPILCDHRQETPIRWLKLIPGGVENGFGVALKTVSVWVRGQGEGGDDSVKSGGGKVVQNIRETTWDIFPKTPPPFSSSPLFLFVCLFVFLFFFFSSFFCGGGGRGGGGGEWQRECFFLIYF